MGSEIGVSSSISAVSAVARTAVAMGEDGVTVVCLLEQLVHFFDALTAGHRGHKWKSWPTSLHRGHALLEPGHDAMTLKPRMSKKGVADRVLPAWILRTKSQQLDCNGVPLYICGAIAITSP